MARETTTTGSPNTHYHACRLNWRRSDDPWWVRLPGTTRLTSHPDADSAETERCRLEAEARAVINPFACDRTLCERTSLDAGRLNDWLLDLGLTPPAGTMDKPPDWVKWWEQNHQNLSEHQRDKVWEALDRLRFHEVVEAPVRPVVYVVVEIIYLDLDDAIVADAEGGRPLKVFRSRAEAEDYCREFNASLINDQGVYDRDQVELGERLRCRNDPLGLQQTLAGAGEDDPPPRAEIIEVEVEGEMALECADSATPAPIFLVQRTSWFLCRSYECPWPYCAHWTQEAEVAAGGDGVGVPVAAFTAPHHAEARCAELSAEARRYLSPLMFIPFGDPTGDIPLAIVSSHPEKTWLRRVRQAGLPPPTAATFPREWGGIDWPAWWDTVAHQADNVQRQVLWDLCDQLVLYQVVAVEAVV